MTPPSLADLDNEQSQLELPSFDYATAWTLGLRMQLEASARSLPVAIEVSHGNTVVFFALLPGATPDNPDWTRRKRAVALRYHKSSLYMRLLCEQHGWDFHDRFRLPQVDFAASGGGVPIVVRGVGVVGAAAVSGLPDVEDHGLVASAIAGHLLPDPREGQ
ncbi:MAG: heme-degrading domain-containing protein [Alphaproteobacteria bacterium]|nr:heme-degrading domain-containing protein [Alphaproteobacteria bacterium]MBU1562425.1 heme-degrading domain-containing protein [Alphaproteobacteria bacterium]MBU2304110.1 heme-degrading domain-containing protein [Alphaproteobacteria bacterium]MBU2369172.1 heme-degrading domain-containing protein [Alphaproteobacteria bacterium]